MRSQDENQTNAHGMPTAVPGWFDIISRLCGIVEGRAGKKWWLAFSFCFLLVLGLVAALFYMTVTGVGVLGANNQVLWGWDIVNFVFWIGIGHAGTLISAILLLSGQKWRRSVSRISEAMTIFAVLCAGIYPVFHMGRVWMSWFFAPVPEANAMWQNFLSPLMWDAFAVGSYFTLSFLFLYASMIPDLGILRDRAGQGRRARFYGLLALGWRGDHAQWASYRRMTLLLAGILAPLVISVHSVVSYDFAATVIPGWHSTLFPPYFVVGAILGGLAMVLLVVIPLRAMFDIRDLITARHLESLSKLLLAMSMAIGFSYLLETGMAFYSGVEAEIAVMNQRMFGDTAPAFWAMVFCNVIAPLCLWFRRVRRNISLLVAVSLCVTLGMWLERYVIIIGTTSRSLMPANWTEYLPSFVDVTMFAGTAGLFFGLILLFVRFFPCVGIAELCEPSSEEEFSIEHGKASVSGETDQEAFVFASAGALRQALIRENSSGEEENDIIMPYPVSTGREKESASPGLLSLGAFAGGLVGFVLSALLTGVTQLKDYPLELQGRAADFSRYVGFFPVLFESTLLGAGLGCLVMFIKECGLLQWWHPWFESPRYEIYRRHFPFCFFSEKKNPPPVFAEEHGENDF